MLISRELGTRILNLRYLLAQLDCTEAQRRQFQRLLKSAEAELMEIYEGCRLGGMVSIYSKANLRRLPFED